MTSAFKSFLHNALTKRKKPSIKQRLRSLAEKVKTNQKERTREKSKSREAEL